MSVERNARVEKAPYLPHLNETHVTVSIPGEHEFQRAEVVQVVQKEGKP